MAAPGARILDFRPQSHVPPGSPRHRAAFRRSGVRQSTQAVLPALRTSRRVSPSGELRQLPTAPARGRRAGGPSQKGGAAAGRAGAGATARDGISHGLRRNSRTTRVRHRQDRVFVSRKSGDAQKVVVVPCLNGPKRWRRQRRAALRGEAARPHPRTRRRRVGSFFRGRLV
jgi:hypothetical protein